MQNSADWVIFAAAAGAENPLTFSHLPHCEAADGKPCGLCRLSAQCFKISIAAAKSDDRCLYGGKDCRL
jgi:hypothetical protein